MYLVRQIAAREDNATRFIESIGDINDKAPEEIGIRILKYLKTQPGGRLSLGGLTYLKTLAMLGQLPGFRGADENQQANVSISPLDLRQADSATYPAERTYYARPSNEPSCSYYVVAKESDLAEWKLQKAWRTDDQGRFLESYDNRQFIDAAR